MLYSVASVFVNLTNSYDVEKLEPEMVKLAQYAKQHIPEPHPKVRPDKTNTPGSWLLF